VNSGDRSGDRSDSPAVVLSAGCRPFRRALRPVVWVVLEEVALDAELEAGRLVARTSARQIAERLGVNPGTAAEALRVLAVRGLVSLERVKGPAGRFGLSVYQLRPPAGLSVLRPCAAEPSMVLPLVVQPDTVGAAQSSPCAAEPYVESPSMVSPDGDGAVQLSPCAVVPHAESSCLDGRASGRADREAETEVRPIAAPPESDSSAAAPGEGSPRRPGRSFVSSGSSGDCPGQTALDFGLGSS